MKFYSIDIELSVELAKKNIRLQNQAVYWLLNQNRYDEAALIRDMSEFQFMASLFEGVAYMDDEQFSYIKVA